MQPTAQTLTCRYCGATLTTAPARDARVRVEEHYSVKVRVGPSNVERVARAIAAERRMDAAAALALVRAGDFEVPVDGDAAVAAALADRLVEDGAIASVACREEVIPLPPDADVLLDDAGDAKVAVIAALRAHVDMSLLDAKRLVESAPCVLVAGMDGEMGQALIAALIAAGAKARAR